MPSKGNKANTAASEPKGSKKNKQAAGKGAGKAKGTDGAGKKKGKKGEAGAAGEFVMVFGALLHNGARPRSSYSIEMRRTSTTI